jgi:excisionase family DNA binding protein
MKSENNASFYNRGPEDGHLNGLLTAHEVSQMLRIPLSTVYHLTSVGKLQAVRIGKHWRYHRSDVEKFLFGDQNIIVGAQFIAPNGQDKGVMNPAPTHNKHSNDSYQKRKSPRLNTHLPCTFEIIIPGWKKITGVAAIRKISEEGVYLRKIEVVSRNSAVGADPSCVIPAEAGIQNLDPRLKHSGMTPYIEPDDPIVLRFHLLGDQCR